MVSNPGAGLIQGAAYASGKRASAQCPVCGDVVAYSARRKRWDGLFVCRPCLDPHHPAERRKAFKDAVALKNPMPENFKGEVEVGFGMFAITHDEAGSFTVEIV